MPGQVAYQENEGLNRRARRKRAALERAGRYREAQDETFLLSDRSAAAWLDISRATFWRRVHDGTFPQPIRFGGVTRWRRDALLAAIEHAAADC